MVAVSFGGLSFGGGEEAAGDFDAGRGRFGFAQDAAGEVGVDLAELVAVDLHVVARPALAAGGAAQQGGEDRAEAQGRGSGRDRPEQPVSRHACLVRSRGRTLAFRTPRHNRPRRGLRCREWPGKRRMRPLRRRANPARGGGTARSAGARPVHATLFRLRSRPGSAPRSFGLAARLGGRGAEGELPGGDRRGRRAWPRNRLLSREKSRHPRRGGTGEGMARRRKYRAEHHDHPLELPAAGARRDLREGARASTRR